jgi:hypothetical protein
MTAEHENCDDFLELRRKEPESVCNEERERLTTNDYRLFMRVITRPHQRT